MKKSIIRIIILITISVVSVSCRYLKEEIFMPELKTETRIIVKQSRIIDSQGVTILEIDGVEYVSLSSGGICPLVIK